MKKKYLYLLFGILIGTGGYFLGRHFSRGDKYFIKELINNVVEAVENEDTDKIEKFFSASSPEKSKRIEEAREYFENYNPLDIEIKTAKYEIKEKTAIAALLLIVTTDFENMGKIKGRQTVGVELVKEPNGNYRGWKIVKVKYN